MIGQSSSLIYKLFLLINLLSIKNWIKMKNQNKNIVILILLFIFLIFFYFSFVICNKIPYREIRIDIESRPRYCAIDKLDICLTYEYTGNLFFLKNKPKSNNLDIKFTPSTSIKDHLLNRHDSALRRKIDSTYCIKFPKDTLFTDSLVAMFKMIYLTNLDFNPLSLTAKGLTKYKNDKFQFYIQYAKEKDTCLGLFTGYSTTSFYKSGFSKYDYTMGGLQLYTFKSPHFYSPYDASQCYIRLNFKNEYPKGIYLTDTSKNIIKIDFKGPAIFEAIQPQPDSTTISSVIYTDLNKIRTIVKSEGFFCKVSLPLTQNLQNTRNFILMTIMTLLFTTICTLGYKILRSRPHKRITIEGFSCFAPHTSKKSNTAKINHRFQKWIKKKPHN